MERSSHQARASHLVDRIRLSLRHSITHCVSGLNILVSRFFTVAVPVPESIALSRCWLRASNLNHQAKGCLIVHRIQIFYHHGADPFYHLIHCVVTLPVESLKFCKTISPSRRITYRVSDTQFFLGVVSQSNCVATLVVESFGFRSIILPSKRITHRVSDTNLIALRLLHSDDSKPPVLSHCYLRSPNFASLTLRPEFRYITIKTSGFC